MNQQNLLGAERAERSMAVRCALGVALSLSMLLAACGGGTDTALASDDQADSATASAESTRAQALAATPAAAPPATATWTACAVEGGTCTLPAAATVRYGANGAYYYKTVTDAIGCNNTQWGDPIFGTVKSCAYTGSGTAGAPAPAPTPTPTPAPTPSTGWVACAGEGGACSVPSPRNVRYGANGAYFYKTVSASIACTNGAWGGDPIFGIVKSCDYDSGTSATPPSSTGWTDCANEGGTCSFSGTRNVRYGANGVYAFKTVTGSIACSNGAWGGDPLVGTVKSCAYDNGGTVAAPAPTPTPAPGPAPTPPVATLGTATLGWSASGDSRVTGYRVYWGNAPGSYQQSRGNGLAAGTATGYVVRDLPAGRTYYFAVTAYDASGSESTFSSEASKTIP